MVGNALLALDLGLYRVNRLICLHFKIEGLASNSFNEYVHTLLSSQHEHRLVLNIIVSESASILQGPALEEETLLGNWNLSLILHQLL